MSDRGQMLVPKELLIALVMLAVGWTVVSAQSGRRSIDPLRLSGTYQLDRALSDDAAAAADVATRRLRPADRDRVRDGLIGRLDAPEVLALDRVGLSVTVASSLAPRVTFDADGRPRREPVPGGGVVTTRAELLGEALTVSTLGNRNSDFTVTFQPAGSGLRVTRRIDADNLPAPVEVRSIYHRTYEEARWDVYAGAAPRAEWVVPDGARLVATLDRDLDTRTAREGDRFTMTVRAPGEFRDAVIDGRVARVIGRSGGADMALDFDRVRFADGRTEDFRAELDTVRTPNGAPVHVNRAGSMPQGNVSDATPKQGAIGAALGAIIGAVAGGAKGAVVGAVVGVAGTVAIEGVDLRLPIGSELTVIAVRPR